MQKQIDIVVPCYNEQDNVVLFYDEVVRVLSESRGSGSFASGTVDSGAMFSFDFTVYFVDDGSTDETMSEIKKLVDFHGDRKVKYLSFSRNFGKEAAIYGGLKAATGDIVVLMDADLQHPPTMLPEMIKVIEEGYDSCATYRKKRRGESFMRTFFSKGFYRLFNLISSIKVDASATDFRMMTRKMADAVVSLSETERFTKGLFKWVGFKTKHLECESIPRIAGKSKWRLSSLFNYAINGIVAFSTAPLRLAAFIGFLIIIAGVCYTIYMLIGAFFYGRAGGGFVTTITLLLFIGGIIITLLGIIGEYIARIYMETKRRPIFIIREANTGEDKIRDGK